MRGSPFFTVLMGDSRSYDEWARRIAGGEWIGREVFYQAPLYPYFLGVLYAIAGHHLLLVRIVQAILGHGSAAMTRHYQHVLPAMLTDAGDRLASFFAATS